MKHLSVWMIALLMMVSTHSARAGIISGTHYTDGGKLVNLSNLEWLSWDVTIGISRNDIETGALGLLDDGWRYATRLELSDLFRSIINSPGQSALNSDGTKWLWEIFDNPSFNAPAYTPGGSVGLSRAKNLFVGADGECRVDPTQSCRALWTAYTRDDLGYVDGSGYNSVYNNYIDKSTSTSGNLGDLSQVASVLVRVAKDQSTQVPEPSSTVILSLGLLGMLFYRRQTS